MVPASNATGIVEDDPGKRRYGLTGSFLSRSITMRTTAILPAATRGGCASSLQFRSSHDVVETCRDAGGARQSGHWKPLQQHAVSGSNHAASRTDHSGHKVHPALRGIRMSVAVNSMMRQRHCHASCRPVGCLKRYGTTRPYEDCGLGPFCADFRQRPIRSFRRESGPGKRPTPPMAGTALRMVLP